MILGLPTLFGHSRLLQQQKTRSSFELHSALGLSKAQGSVVGEEIGLVNLNYRFLARKIIRRSWRFFAVRQLFTLPPLSLWVLGCQRSETTRLWSICIPRL